MKRVNIFNYFLDKDKFNDNARDELKLIFYEFARINNLIKRVDYLDNIRTRVRLKDNTSKKILYIYLNEEYLEDFKKFKDNNKINFKEEDDNYEDLKPTKLSILKAREAMWRRILKETKDFKSNNIEYI